MEGCLGGDTSDEVDGLGVDVSFVLIRVVLLSNGDASQRRTLLPQEGDNGPGVHPANGWHALSGAPLAQALDSCPMAMMLCNICNDDTCCLNIRRLKVSEKAVLVTGGGRDAVVADQRLCEDQDLATIGRVGHGLWIADEGRRENSLAGDV